MFLGKSILKIHSKFTGEQTCRSVISIMLQSNFIEVAFRNECSPVNLLYIFRTPFPEAATKGVLYKKVFLEI